MIRTIAGKTPQVDAKAYVFEDATVVGNVIMKEFSNVGIMRRCASKTL